MLTFEQHIRIFVASYSPFPVGSNEDAPASISTALDIYSLMDKYFKADIPNDACCDQCRVVGRTVTKLNIIKSPKLLVLHLLRFKCV